MAQKILVYFFAIAVPVIGIALRVMNKLKTLHTIILIISSLLISIIAYDSLQEDPVDAFVDLVNRKKTTEAKRAFKVLVQYGPDYLNRIDESKIVYKSSYFELKKEIGEEYMAHCLSILEERKRNDSYTCDRLEQHKSDIKYLNHAQKLYGYALSLDVKDPYLNDELQKELQKKSEAVEKLTKTCGKE